jgi:hypothetical protein
VICGTRGVPGTVAPFRAWRGSRDLVAQSPKFHVSTAAKFLRLLNKSLAQPSERSQIVYTRRYLFFKQKISVGSFGSLARIVGRIHVIYFEWPNAVNLHQCSLLGSREVMHASRH